MNYSENYCTVAQRQWVCKGCWKWYWQTCLTWGCHKPSMCKKCNYLGNGIKQSMPVLPHNVAIPSVLSRFTGPSPAPAIHTALSCFFVLLATDFPLRVQSIVSQSCPLFATLWTIAHQAPLSMRFSRQNTGVDCHFLLQWIFPSQGSNLGLPHWRQILYCLSHKGSPDSAKLPLTNLRESSRLLRNS